MEFSQSTSLITSEDKITEAQRGEVTRPRSHSVSEAWLGLRKAFFLLYHSAAAKNCADPPPSAFPLLDKAVSPTHHYTQPHLAGGATSPALLLKCYFAIGPLDSLTTHKENCSTVFLEDVSCCTDRKRASCLHVTPISIQLQLGNNPEETYFFAAFLECTRRAQSREKLGEIFRKD